jgi:hypothetical protein
MALSRQNQDSPLTPPSTVNSAAITPTIVGTYIWSNGQRYRGNWRDDQPDGEGEWTSSAGDRYLGGFIKGKRQGQGRMVYADKSEYNGTWRDDLPTGAGEQKFLNGNVYSGEFLAGMQTGIGTLTHRNGDRYTGNWLNGRRHGKGVAQWNDGQSYDGTWVGDQATGQGVIKFASGDSYTGEVSDGQPQGKGIYTWGSGDKFEGEFSAGKPTANGQMTFFIVPTAEIAATVPLTDASAVSGTGSGAVTSSISKVTLCSRGYNAARSVVALKQFIDAFPADECGRHALARQKMAVLEENERRVSRELADRQGQAKALVGLVVAYRQEYVHCVPDQDEKCQNIVYVFEVRGKIREVNVARQSVQLQVVEVSGLANDKGAPAKLYSDGRVAANQAFRKRVMGSIQTKSKNEVGLEF